MSWHLLWRRRILSSAFLAFLVVLTWLTFSHGQVSSLSINGALSEQLHQHEESGSLRNIFNRTLGFQKIFVINLPARTDHRDAMSLGAALTHLDVEYIDGVKEVVEKATLHKTPDSNLKPSDLGAWRAHTNIALRMVEQNITSALVLEDDADWDIRIKSQMRDFARAARLLLQPLAGTMNEYADPTYPRPHPHAEPLNMELDVDETTKPTTSPYGDIDRWDLLWLGHCGCRFPHADDENSPLGRAVILNDTTVPEKRHLNMEFGDTTLLDEYPQHTRVVSRARMNTCSTAYGISLPGARRVLYEMGLNKLSGPADMMFRSICHGSEGRKIRTCLSVQPQLFQHYRPKGPKSGFSDIAENEGYNDKAFTINVRWSTQINIPRLLDGLEDYIDSYPDRKMPKTDSLI